jgi:hypothetical protein
MNWEIVVGYVAVGLVAFVMGEAFEWWHGRRDRNNRERIASALERIALALEDEYIEPEAQQ